MTGITAQCDHRHHHSGLDSANYLFMLVLKPFARKVKSFRAWPIGLEMIEKRSGTVSLSQCTPSQYTTFLEVANCEQFGEGDRGNVRRNRARNRKFWMCRVFALGQSG